MAQRRGAPQGRDLVDAPRTVFSEERRQPVGVLGAATLGVRPRRRPAAPPSASTICAFRDGRDAYPRGGRVRREVPPVGPGDGRLDVVEDGPAVAATAADFDDEMSFIEWRRQTKWLPDSFVSSGGPVMSR